MEDSHAMSAGHDQMGAVGALVRTARPKQWIKNVLVFAAAAFSGNLDEADVLWPTLVTFVAFCLASAGTYFVNDAADVEADRRHPKKRSRPIAAGLLSTRLGFGVGAALMAVGIGLGFAVQWRVGVVIAVYLAITAAYTVWLKHEPVLDLFAVATGFVLRAIAGGVATDIALSNWFLIIVSAGSLFIVTSKRSAEHEQVGVDAGSRGVLARYPASYLAFVRAASAASAGLAHCLWSFERSEAAGSSFPWFELSTVPFVVALFRYAYMVDIGHGSSPEDVILGDRTLQAVIAVWLALVAFGIYA